MVGREGAKRVGWSPISGCCVSSHPGLSVPQRSTPGALVAMRNAGPHMIDLKRNLQMEKRAGSGSGRGEAGREGGTGQGAS